jgi:hypothetical protein
MVKPCRNCRILKPLEEFPHFSTKEAGRKNTCKECSKKLVEIRKNLKLKNPPPLPGVCPICELHTDNWILDHCHFSNEFRGYICNSCNLGIGRFNDDVRLLENAIAYLKQNFIEDYQI